MRYMTAQGEGVRQGNHQGDGDGDGDGKGNVNKDGVGVRKVLRWRRWGQNREDSHKINHQPPIINALAAKQKYWIQQ